MRMSEDPGSPFRDGTPTGFLSPWRQRPWLLIYPVATTFLAGITGLIGNTSGHPPWMAAGVQLAQCMIIFFVLWAIHRLTAGADRTQQATATPKPWHVLIALVCVHILFDTIVGRILFPGSDMIRDGGQTLVQAISAPLLALVPAGSFLARRIVGAVQNSLFFIVLPWLIALAFGSRFDLKGLTRRSMLLGLLFSSPFILINLVEWVTKPPEFAYDMVILFTNAFTNGYAEEFLYRGIIQPRLIQVTRSPLWGIALGSLVFGIIHYWANLKALGSPGLALASCLLAQAQVGIVLGYIVYRTRSLLGASIFHVWMNT